MVPGMVLFLAIPQHRAHATSLAAMIASSAAAVIPLALSHSIDWDTAGFLVVGSMLGAYLGARMFSRIPEVWLAGGFVLLALASAVRMLIERDAAGVAQTGTPGIDASWIGVIGFVLVGFFAGALGALMGVGGGIVNVPALVTIYSFEQHLAQGTSLAVIIPTAIVAAITHSKRGHVDWRLAITLASGGLAGGWLGGRSEPPNASAMRLDDFDGLTCDFCHPLYDPFFQDTYDGLREGNDWTGYWDETGLSALPSGPAADITYQSDISQSLGILNFNGSPFFGLDHRPFSAGYTENGSGQYFVSELEPRRASFADAFEGHDRLYSRYHKSRFFCSTCHDVSNPLQARDDQFDAGVDHAVRTEAVGGSKLAVIHAKARSNIPQGIPGLHNVYRLLWCRFLSRHRPGREGNQDDQQQTNPPMLHGCSPYPQC